MTIEFVTLPPTTENVAKATRFNGQVWIDGDSRKRGGRSLRKLHRLADGRYFVLCYLGHWRRFVTGVKVLMIDGVESTPRVELGAVEPRKQSGPA